MAFKGRHKISDKWVKDPYVIVDIPIAGIPVFRVQKESDSSITKTLHRNLLLPFSAIPGTSQVNEYLPPSPMRTRQRKAKPQPVVESGSEHSSGSDQEEEIIPVPRYVPPHRRKPSGSPHHLHPVNVLGNSTFNLQGHTEGSNISNITNYSSGPTSRGVSLPDVQSSPSTNMSNNQTSQSSISDQSPIVPSVVSPAPRRSGWNSQAPQRFGDWVYQQSVDDSDLVEYFV